MFLLAAANQAVVSAGMTAENWIAIVGIIVFIGGGFGCWMFRGDRKFTATLECRLSKT